MTAPLAGPELEDALRQLLRDLKVIDNAIHKVNVVAAPMALWSIRAVKHQLDGIRPRYSACLAGIGRQAARPETPAGTGLAGLITGEGSAPTAGLIALLDVRDRWSRVDASLDRVTAQALGWLSIWLGTLSVLISLLALR
jgi:hypothetical protein